MTVKDIMTLLESPDRVRVIKDGEEIYNQYFANMDHILPDLFRREPALVGESKLKLVAVELRFCGTEYRRYFRELHFSDAGKVVRYLLLFVSYLFRIGEHKNTLCIVCIF